MDTTCTRSFDELIASSNDGKTDLIVSECDRSVQSVFAKGIFGLPAWESMINTGVVVALRERSSALGSLLADIQSDMARRVGMSTLSGIDYLDMLGPP